LRERYRSEVAEVRHCPEEKRNGKLNRNSRHYHPDTLADNVTRQLLQQVGGDVVRVGVQWSNIVMLGCNDGGTPASVSDHVTLLTEGHYGSPARYHDPARHQLTAYERTRSNEAFVVVTHQPVELGVADLHTTILKVC